ncbi:MAG: ABC-2 family transporter protein [Candidatus Kerfeldbacteria bacterium]|nr:ABC-2 family transporter protein [Candidatus Kerfeldbacteria bacterium]
MRRYIHLLQHFAKVSIMNQMAYPPSFFLAILGKSLRVGTLLLFFQAIYLHTPFLGDWSADDILILLATWLTLELLIIITFHRNLTYFLAARLRDGTFDLLLTKPVNTLFYASFRVIDFMDVISAVPVIALWGYIASRGIVTGGWLAVALFLVLLALGYLFFFAFTVLIAATGFWTLAPTGVGRLYENIVRLARYPSSVFRGAGRFTLLYLFPIVTAVSVPANVLRGNHSWMLALYFFCFTVALFTVALVVWRYALRRYSSASS